MLLLCSAAASPRRRWGMARARMRTSPRRSRSNPISTTEAQGVSMRRKAWFAFGVLCVGVPGWAVAQTDQQFRQCNGADPALAIIGCTAIIESRDTLAPLRSRALANRGLAYMSRGQSDRALPDFDRAIMTDSK